MPEPTICISIVTFNSSRYIRRCLESVLRQRGVRLDIVVVDNASADSTREILAQFGDRIRVIANQHNAGFAAAQNQGIRSGRGEWVLTLNPDLLMGEDFLAQLVEAGYRDPAAGVVCGKLLAIGAGFRPLAEPRIDSTGIYFTPSLRHFDRGWNQPDDGSYERAEYVFGACAAGALYRRQMIDDVAIGGEFFDPDFFAYREDADVAWRAQLYGLAVHLHAGGCGLACAQRAAGRPADDFRDDQHAFGEEPVPDADQEFDVRPLPGVSTADGGARPGGGGGMPADGAAVAAGVLEAGEVLAGSVETAAGNHAAAEGSGRGVDALVPVRTGE